MTRAKPFAKCRTPVTTCNITISRDDSNESIRTMGSDAPLQVKQGDLVLVKEADSALHNDCVHVKLTHDR